MRFPLFTKSIDFVKKRGLSFVIIAGFTFPLITKANQNEKWLEGLTSRPYILVLTQDCPSCAKLTQKTLRSCQQTLGAKSIFILALGEESKMKTQLFGLKNFDIKYIRSLKTKRSLNIDVTPSLFNKTTATWLKGATEIKDFLEDKKNELCKS